MKYLPILQELLESDLYLFFLIGMAAAVMTGLRMKNRKKTGIGIGAGYLIEFIFHTYKINVRRRRADGSGQNDLE